MNAIMITQGPGAAETAPAMVNTWIRGADMAQRTRSVEARFWEKVDKSGDCWIWTGVLNHGYGGFAPIHGLLVLTHRFAYELLIGPIPEGLQLDHLCRVRSCVNPAHLEPVTQKENNRRAQAIKTHCPSGHPYDEVNTYLWQGRRKCRECRRIRGKASWPIRSAAHKEDRMAYRVANKARRAAYDRARRIAARDRG
jgi:hypothetical protein